ncbi:MAG: tRNA (guanosine(46)-N7)-methyltransferase TrmB [Phycisphaerae bacterium]|nr:tRNA (guanosine(46)-N7)-methyltransferase TrmB [Phycisphaerae bacterium]
MSYGLGHGRSLEPGTAGLTQRDLPPAESGRLSPGYFFPSRPHAPFELEIGSGKGTFLLQQAPLNPETNFLGIEYAGEFYRYGADRLRRAQVPNARMLYADAVEFVTHWLSDASCRVVHLYFSDPWPKTRHHKRRVVQDATLMQFHRILVAGGELRLVTDHDMLWAWYEEHAQRNAHLFARRAFETPTSATAGEVVGTNFERKYRREGRPFHAMTLVKT